MESKLFENFATLARNPGLGHKREDLTRLPVRFYRAFPYQYMIVYRPTSPLEIVSVLHGRRNLKEVLERRELT